MLHEIFFNLKYKSAEVTISPISKPVPSVAPSFSKNIEHTVDYQPSTINYKDTSSPGYLLNFFSNLYVLPWLQKSFKFMVLTILVNTFVSQNIDLLIFTYATKQKSYHYPQAE